MPYPYEKLDTLAVPLLRGAMENASLELLSVVDRRMLSEPRRADYARFLRDTYGPRARRLGFTPRAGEDEDPRLREALRTQQERKVRQQLLGALGNIMGPEVVRQQLPLVLGYAPRPGSAAGMKEGAPGWGAAWPATGTLPVPRVFPE